MKKPLSFLLGAAVVTVIGAAPAAAPPGHFVLEENDTVVRDTKTNLRWERTAASVIRTRSGSVTYCEGLGGGFRVPTIKELLTIVDREEPGPVKWPVAFFAGENGDYWSSTRPPGADGERYYVAFATGASGASDNGSRYVRCVK